MTIKHKRRLSVDKIKEKVEGRRDLEIRPDHGYKVGDFVEYDNSENELIHVFEIVKTIPFSGKAGWLVLSERYVGAAD